VEAEYRSLGWGGFAQKGFKKAKVEIHLKTAGSPSPKFLFESWV